MKKEYREIYKKMNLFPIFKAGFNKAPAIKKGTSWKDSNNHVTSIEGMTEGTYGLVCGEKSGIMVLDIDAKEKAPADIIRDLCKAAEVNQEEFEVLKRTFTVKTPNGGLHLYFKYREGLTNINSEIMKNVDFKTEGGYVIAPYSLVDSVDGHRRLYTPVRGESIEELPESLYSFIKSKGHKKKSPAPKPTTASADDTDPFAILRGLKPGDGRNSALNSALYSYCKRKNIKDKTVIIALAEKINTEYFTEPEEGAYKTAESVFKALSEGDDASSYLYEEKGKMKLNTALLARYIHNNCDYLIVRKNGFDQDFLYWYQEGHYKRISVNEMKGKIKEYIPLTIRKTFMYDEVYKQLVTDKTTVKVEDLDTDRRYINFKNGLYNVETRELEPHTPKVLSTIQINSFYEPKAGMPLRFNRYLDFLTENDESLKAILQEWAGLTISNIPGYSPKKAMALYGPNGNNGKSVFINVLDHLIGTENIATRDIQDLSKSFGTSDLYGKKALLIDDQKEADFTDSSIFKSITGGGLIPCEFKGKQSFSYRFNGTVTFGCNELPYLAGEKGSHIFERLLIIPCYNVLEEKQRDSGLLDELKTELEAITLWAIEGLHRLIENRFMFTRSEATEIAVQEYRMKSDSLYRFVLEHCEMTGYKEDRILKSTFENDYELWANENDIKPIARKNIKDRAQKIGIRFGKVSNHYYMGIKYKLEEEDLPKQPYHRFNHEYLEEQKNKVIELGMMKG